MIFLIVWIEGFVIDKVMPEIDNQPIDCDEDNLEVHGGIVSFVSIIINVVKYTSLLTLPIPKHKILYSWLAMPN